MTTTTKGGGRDVFHVIDFLLQEVVPAEAQGLHNRLAAIRRSAPFVAPESLSIVWRQIASAFEEFVVANEPWCRRASRILRDEETIPDDFKPLHAV